MPDLDLSRLAVLLGIVSTSNFEGERASALRAADKELRNRGMVWADLLQPFRDLEVAVEAARVLLAEKEQLREEYERLRAAVGQSTAVELWAEVRDRARTAKWCLAEHAAHRLYLNEFEEDFLGTVSRWGGALTENQQPVFDRIIEAVTRRNGGRPPP